MVEWHDIDNKGFELTLNYTDKLGDVGFDVSGVFSHNKTENNHVPDEVINNFAVTILNENILGRPNLLCMVILQTVFPVSG